MLLSCCKPWATCLYTAQAPTVRSPHACCSNFRKHWHACIVGYRRHYCKHHSTRTFLTDSVSSLILQFAASPVRLPLAAARLGLRHACICRLRHMLHRQPCGYTASSNFPTDSAKSGLMTIFQLPLEATPDAAANSGLATRTCKPRRTDRQTRTQ